MKHAWILLATALTLAGAQARASDVAGAPASPPPGATAAAPQSAAPQGPPPPPPVEAAHAPKEVQVPQPVGRAVVVPAGVPDGHWVYTQQYGWLFMPYGDAYWYAPPGGVGQPIQYAYYPTRGWLWVSAPWIWGIGPWPWFGQVGPANFGWYASGWWRVPARWHYRPVPVRGGVVVYGRPRGRVVVR